MTDELPPLIALSRVMGHLQHRPSGRGKRVGGGVTASGAYIVLTAGDDDEGRPSGVGGWDRSCDSVFKRL